MMQGTAIGRVLGAVALVVCTLCPVAAQPTSPAVSPPGAASGAAPQPAPTTPKDAGQAPTTTPAPPAADTLAPSKAPRTDEIEPNGSPTTPGVATTETVEVPARPIVYIKGQSSYDDGFKSIKAALATVRGAMDKAGLKPTGHPITIFTDTDDKGFKYEVGVPIEAVPAPPPDLANGVTIGHSPSGQALKFQHRGPYDEIDSTYATITSYLDNKGLQTDSPYIEEYLGDLKSPDDPYFAVDIYIFLKR